MSLSDNCHAAATRAAYAAEVAKWLAYAESVEGGDVVAYLESLHAAGNAPQTLRKAVAALRAAGIKGAEGADVRRALRGAEKARQRAPKAAPAMSLADLRLISVACAADGSWSAQRDRAAILLAFWGSLRSEHIASLNLEDIEGSDRGVLLHIGREKQGLTGRIVAIEALDDPQLDPVRALQSWLSARGNCTGNHGVFLGTRGERIAREVFTRAVAAWSKRAGCSRRYSAHSLRAGLITAAAQAGVSEELIARTSGHRSVEVLRGYIRRATVWDCAITRHIVDNL